MPEVILGPENLHLAEVALRKLQPNAGFAGVALAKPRKYAVEMALAFRSRSKNRFKIRFEFQFAFGSILGSKMEPKMLPNRAREPPKTLLEHASCRTLLPDTFFMVF